MSKLNIDQRSIRDLLTDKRSDFLIPDYQRPYAWGEDECATLWDDLFSFAFPGDDYERFDSENDEYFLGPIVTFKNLSGQLEIIDGQQRLTTIMLLLRAFYDKFTNMKDKQSVKMREAIARCVWKTDEFDEPDMERLKIDSEVASDNDKNEFLEILREGNVGDGWKSAYARNFAFFQRKIEQLVSEWPTYTVYMATRVINNVILLPIEAESQDTALRIFSTLNDRGLPLSDADIFKSQFYKHYSDTGRKDEFIRRWKGLEEGANAIFRPMRGTPTDELFTRYMYYRRAKKGIRDTTTASLRDFFGADGYAILKEDATLGDLEALLGFWKLVDAQEGFSERVLRRLFVLNYAPNGMWTYLLSVWFLANSGSKGVLDDEALYGFLNKITAFIFAYAIERPGVNALRSPVYPEMINIVEHRPVEFPNHHFNRANITERFRTYVFTNGRPVTKSMLTWWAYADPDQPLMDLDTTLEIEHIYAKKRNEIDPLVDQSNLEALGNKALLEKRVNIRAADYRFCDKRKYYEGYTDGNGKRKAGTKIAELKRLTQVEAVILHKSQKLQIKDKDNQVEVELQKDVSMDPAFQQLWERIRQTTRFEMDIDTDLLVEKAVDGIAHMPKIKPLEVMSIRAGLEVGDAGVSVRKKKDLFGDSTKEDDITRSVVRTDIERVYDLPDPISELQDAVGLTRKTIKRILEECGRLKEFEVDPMTFLVQVAAKIEAAKNEVVSQGIKYTKLPESEWYTMDILAVEDLTAYLDQNAWKPTSGKSLYNYVVYDSSTVEKPYALALDQSEQVKVFAKLPSKFKIDTPLGSYNPDWAYVEEVEGKERVYFVMETKGGGNGTPNLRPTEKAKIECAQKHFDALAIDDVVYDVETTYHYANI